PEVGGRRRAAGDPVLRLAGVGRPRTGDVALFHRAFALGALHVRLRLRGHEGSPFRRAFWRRNAVRTAVSSVAPRDRVPSPDSRSETPPCPSTTPTTSSRSSAS